MPANTNAATIGMLPHLNDAVILIAMPNEVEIKFLISDRQALEEKLRAKGFREQTPSTHEMNTLYDFPGSTLRSKGQLLRIRKFGEKWKLTHKAKGTLGKHKSRLETETSVGNGENLAAIFESLGLKPSFRYEKFRAEWTDGKGEVVLDHTPIGDLGEIEGEPDWIDHVAKLLGIDEDQYITGSYTELFQQFKRRTGCKAENMTFAECGTK
jgi:adenylate cyclase, class 2